MKHLLAQSREPKNRVGRATVPADTGRHGGRPYFSDEVGLAFLIFFWKMRKQKNPVNPVNPVNKKIKIRIQFIIKCFRQL